MNDFELKIKKHEQWLYWKILNVWSDFIVDHGTYTPEKFDKWNTIKETVYANGHGDCDDFALFIIEKSIQFGIPDSMLRLGIFTRAEKEGNITTIKGHMSPIADIDDTEWKDPYIVPSVKAFDHIYKISKYDGDWVLNYSYDLDGNKYKHNNYFKGNK